MWSCNFKGGHMPEEVFIKALPFIHKAKATNVVGGEPSLHPNCRTYMTMLSSVVEQIRFVTNGSLINRFSDVSCSIITTSEKLGSDNLLVRISNDVWHRKFISEDTIERAGRFLYSKK
jgi:hypothetical protein